LEELGERADSLRRLVGCLSPTERLAVRVPSSAAARSLWDRVKCLELSIPLIPSVPFKLTPGEKLDDYGSAGLPLEDAGRLLGALGAHGTEQPTAADDDPHAALVNRVLEKTLNRPGLLQHCATMRVFRVFESRDEKQPRWPHFPIRERRCRGA